MSGLGPRARHRLSAWLKVSDGNESVSLGVRRAGLEDATAAILPVPGRSGVLVDREHRLARRVLTTARPS